MKRSVVAGVGVLALALGLIPTVAVGATGALSATATTSGSVSALATAEANYTKVLRGYAKTSAWLSEYEAALRVVTAAQATVSADLRPKTPGPEYVFSGWSGSDVTTKPFGLPAGLRNWSVNWSVAECLTGAGTDSNEFTVLIVGGAYGENTATPFSPGDIDLDLPGAPLPAARSQGTQVFATNPGSSSAGTYHFAVTSTCDWTIRLYS